jgi:hypothetical protein
MVQEAIASLEVKAPEKAPEKKDMKLEEVPCKDMKRDDKILTILPTKQPTKKPTKQPTKSKVKAKAKAQPRDKNGKFGSKSK